MNYQTILFDLDGTIADSAPGVTNSFSYALAAYGIHESPADLKKVVGPPLHASFIDFYRFSEEKAFEAVEKYREYYRDRGIFESCIYDGIAELISDLSEAGLELVVASSKPTVFVRQILERFGLADRFSFISASELDGSRTDKAEVVEYALENARGGREHAVLVGDRKFDIVGAHAAGIDAIGVLWGYGCPEEFADAEHVAATVDELRAILLPHHPIPGDPTPTKGR